MNLFLISNIQSHIFASKNKREMATFVFNDETKKNSHGFYLLNAGGKFERFNENPVMLNNHDLAQLTGRWLNLRVEGSQLLAEPEFDDGDPEAIKLKGKVDRGYLRGASPGIVILAAEYRENPVTKDTDIYVTEWELFEGSTVSVPSNAGAITLKVYDSNRCIVNDSNVKCHVEDIIKLSISSTTNLIDKKMNEIQLTAEALVALGITKSADEAAISAAIVRLKAKVDTAETNLEKLEKKAREEHETRVTEMVNLAIKEGRITADKKDAFVKLGIADFETTKTTIEAIPVKQSLAANEKPIQGQGIPKARENWTLLQWMKNDMPGLRQLQVDTPDLYEQIKKK